MPYVKFKRGHIIFVPLNEVEEIFEDEEDGRFYTKTNWGEIALILSKSEREAYLKEQEDIIKATLDWLED